MLTKCHYDTVLSNYSSTPKYTGIIQLLYLCTKSITLQLHFSTALNIHLQLLSVKYNTYKYTNSSILSLEPLFSTELDIHLQLLSVKYTHVQACS